MTGRAELESSHHIPLGIGAYHRQGRVVAGAMVTPLTMRTW
jgi:hypothetical protein